MCSYRDDPQSHTIGDLPDDSGRLEMPGNVGGNGQHDIPNEAAPGVDDSAAAPVVAQAGGRASRAATNLPLRPSWLTLDVPGGAVLEPQTAPAPDPITPTDDKPQTALSLPEHEVASPVSPIQPWVPTGQAEPSTESSWWERTAPYRGAVLGVAAAAVGGVGEALLFQEATRGTGGALLVAAMALAAVAWSSVRGLPLLWLRPVDEKGLISGRRVLLIRLAGIFGALALWAASLWAYFAKPDEIFGLQGQLWIASMLLLLAACARWYPRSGNRAEVGPRWTPIEALILAGIVALSFAMRVTWLEDIPWQIHGDVYTNWRESLNFVYDPPRISAFTTTYLGLGQPSLWFVVPAQFMKVFGTTGQVGIRMAVAVCGSLLVLPVYGIARMSWGRTAAALAAIALAVSASMVHMSRLAMPDMATALWWTCAFYFLLRGLRSRRPGDFVWAGLIAGTSQYTHYASRILPFVLAAFFVYLAIFHFKALRERLGHVGLVAVGFLAGSGPINGYFILHPEMWGSRAGKGFLIPMSIPATWEALALDWNIVSEQLRQNILMFSVIPTRDFFYYGSMLLPWEGVLLALGAACLLWRWKQPTAFLVLLWGGSLLLLNSIIEVPENPNPNLTHFRPAWAAFYLALALPPALWLVSLRRIGRRAWQVGVALVGVGVAWLLASNTYFYLVKYPPMVSAQDSFRTVQGRLYLNTGPGDLVRVVGGTPYYEYDREYARWLGPQTPAGAWFNQTRQLPLVGGTSNNQIFAYLTQNPYAPVIKYYYPDGQVVNLPTSDGQVGVETYRVPARQVQARYGVNASFTQAGAQSNPVWQGQVSSVGALPDGVSLTYPVTATWSGLIYVPMPGEVQARLVGVASSEVWLPGQANPGGPAVLDVGWVPFVAQARLDSLAQLQLLLQFNAVSTMPVDRMHLWPQPPEAGLAVTLGGDGYPHRIDPFVGSSLMWPISNYGDILQPGSLPLNEVFGIFNGPGLLSFVPMERGAIRWEGELYGDGGQYQMDVFTGEDWQARLALDGLPIINQCAIAGGDHMAQVTLSQGWHHVQLDVMGGMSNRGVQWLWTRPDGVREVVPPHRFRYTPSAGPGAPFAWPAKPEPIICQ